MKVLILYKNESIIADYLQHNHIEFLPLPFQLPEQTNYIGKIE
jgi:hypothetical protein